MHVVAADAEDSVALKVHGEAGGIFAPFEDVALGDLGAQRVVVGVGPIPEIVEGAVRLALRLIPQRQHSAKIGVAGIRAGTSGGKTVLRRRAGPTNEDRIIERFLHDQVRRPVAQVRRRNQPISRQLFLDGQVPLLHVGGLGIQLEVAEAPAEYRERSVGRHRRWQRKWIASR